MPFTMAKIPHHITEHPKGILAFRMVSGNPVGPTRLDKAKLVWERQMEGLQKFA